MGFFIRNISGSAVVLDDIGITLAVGETLDLLTEQPNDIATSLDLQAAIAGSPITVVVLDPLDTGGSPSLVLTSTQGLEVVQVHNDPHYRIRGGTLNQLDDVDTTNQPGGPLVLSYTGSPQIWTPVTHAHLGSDIKLDDLQDIIAPFKTGSPAGGSPVSVGTWGPSGSTYVLVSNGANEAEAKLLFGGSPAVIPEFCEAVQDVAGLLIQGGSPTPHSDVSVVYTDNAGLCDGVVAISVDDVFLRNTGDTLDSGTLIISSGADLTIIDPPTVGTDAVNKDYVDSVAAGLDPKESVRAATTADVAGTYTQNGVGSPYPPSTLTGVSAFQDGFQLDTIGDRVLIKDQTNADENGIYEVTVVGAGSPLTVDLQRASDQDGSPAEEISGGNFTFVENGDTLAGTGWVVVGDGVIPLGSDIDWVQFSEAGQVTDGIGLSKAGVVIDLNVADLTVDTISGTDELAFSKTGGSPETASGSTTRKITVSDFVSQLGLDSPNITASNGLQALVVGSPQTTDIQLDILGTPTATITPTDEIIFGDIGNGSPSVNSATTVANFLGDLNIVNNITGNGLVIQTGGSPEYASRSIETYGAGSPNSLGGLAITNGDGVAGNPIIGLDIQNLPARSDAVDTTDRIAVYNITTGENEYYTISEVAGAVSASDSFSTWIGQGNQSGSPATIVADSSADTAVLIGGDGIELTFTPAADSVAFALSRAGLVDTATERTDTFPFFDGSATDQPEFRSFGDMFNDLNVVNNITTNGIIVQTGGSPQYAGRTLVADGIGVLDGLAVTNGDGTAGNPTVGLDIIGTPAAAEDMTANDEVILHNNSGGVGSPAAGANQRFTGQEIADGVLNITNLTGLTVTLIGSPGQPVLTVVDTTRGSKILSTNESNVVFGENTVGNLDWIRIGNSSDALNGFIMPLDATIVRVSAETSNDNGNSKDISLYIDAALNSTLVSFTAVSGENIFVNHAVNIDVARGEKIRLRGDAAGGTIEDTVITVWFKWRG